MPKEVELDTAKQLEWILPRRRGFVIQGAGKSLIATIRESAEFSATNGSREDDEFLFDLEDLEDAFDHFLQKLDDLVSRQDGCSS